MRACVCIASISSATYIFITAPTHFYFLLEHEFIFFIVINTASLHLYICTLHAIMHINIAGLRLYIYYALYTNTWLFEFLVRLFGSLPSVVVGPLGPVNPTSFYLYSISYDLFQILRISISIM